MFTLLLSATEFRAIASTAIAASKDDTTPIISTVQINYSLEANRVTAIATDRYRVARNRFTPERAPIADPGDISVHVDATDVTKFWSMIRTSALKSKEPIWFKVSPPQNEFDTQAYSFEYLGNVVGGSEIRGNYPPVERLMPDATPEWEPAQGVGLKMQFLADLTKLFGATDEPRENLKNTPWQMHTQITDSGKPGAVYITRPLSGDAVVDYLVQPNLILR